jgi:hypothetical protein
VVRFLAGTKDLSLIQQVQTDSEAHGFWVQSTPCPGVKRAVLGINTRTHLVLEIIMIGATPPLLIYIYIYIHTYIYTYIYIYIYIFAACAWTTSPLHFFRRMKGPRLTDIKQAKLTSVNYWSPDFASSKDDYSVSNRQ